MSSPLRLVRDDETTESEPLDAAGRLSAAVEKLIDEPLSPRASPVQVGTLEKFIDIYGGGSRVAWVYHGLAGRDIIVSYPMSADTMESMDAVAAMVEIIKALV